MRISQMPLDESALVLLVPEAEHLVKSFRDRYDPSAAAGVPAHITLLYPFKPPDTVDEAVLAWLHRCFQRFTPFRFTLAPIRRFIDGVLYLAPEPDEPFRQLVLAIWDQYPETPPYGGKWPDIVPHLSVARRNDQQQLDLIATAFAQPSRGRLPNLPTVGEVLLKHNDLTV